MLIENTYHVDELDILEEADQVQHEAQEDTVFICRVLPEVESLIAGQATHEAFVRSLLPKLYLTKGVDYSDLFDADMCVDILRQSCRHGAIMAKKRSAGLLELGLALILPAIFEEQARDVIE